MNEKWHFNLRHPGEGLRRQLAEGVIANVFAGEKMTVSVVELAPSAVSPAPNHPEEQWGFLIAGSITRILDDEKVEMQPGDFWRTPGGVPHGLVTGPEGATVIDVFAPPRQEYLKPGSGYGAASPSEEID